MKFRKRFLKDPYKAEEKQWIEKMAADNNIDIIGKIRTLGRMV